MIYQFYFLHKKKPPCGMGVERWTRNQQSRAIPWFDPQSAWSFFTGLRLPSSKKVAGLLRLSKVKSAGKQWQTTPLCRVPKKTVLYILVTLWSKQLRVTLLYINKIEKKKLKKNQPHWCLEMGLWLSCCQSCCYM